MAKDRCRPRLRCLQRLKSGLSFPMSGASLELPPTRRGGRPCSAFRLNVAIRLDGMTFAQFLRRRSLVTIQLKKLFAVYD